MPSPINRKLASKLRKLRIAKGLSQEQAAQAIGIEYKHYQVLEGTNPDDVKLSTLDKIANGLNIPIWKLLKF